MNEWTHFNSYGVILTCRYWIGLQERFTVGSMVLAAEQISKDGTLKRSYALSDGQQIEVGLNCSIIHLAHQYYF